MDLVVVGRPVVDRQFHWLGRKAVRRAIVLGGLFIRSPRRRDQNGADTMVNASHGRSLLHCTKKLEKEVVKAPTVLIIAEVRQAMCDEMNSGVPTGCSRSYYFVKERK